MKLYVLKQQLETSVKVLTTINKIKIEVKTTTCVLNYHQAWMHKTRQKYEKT